MKKMCFWACFMVLNVLALMPGPYLPPLKIFDWWDKAQHAVGFAALAVTAVLAYPGVSKARLAALLCAQGVAIELLQHWGGYRFGDWQDALADGVGVGLGLVVIKGLMRQEWFARLMRINA